MAIEGGLSARSPDSLAPSFGPYVSNRHTGSDVQRYSVSQVCLAAAHSLVPDVLE